MKFTRPRNCTKLGREVTLQVTVRLDPVPGTMHRIEDHIACALLNNNYVQSVEAPDNAFLNGSPEWERLPAETVLIKVQEV